ncbi:hypothetical protein P8452_30376 [Trifolium repens]|nr:hypothetical protein P8452_30376 [Trifolium repens]
MSSFISSSSRSHKSDVFLSYHDKEACKSFASDLYSALTRAGLVVYINHNNLTSGDQTNFSAIKASRSSIISNFDASRWFLEELEQILDCGRSIGQVVLPVFYAVDPSDVRRQIGIFGKAFEDLIAQRILTNNELTRYKEALIEASSIDGFLVMSSSRLWSHKDVFDVLKGNMGSSTVEGIKLHPPKQEKVDQIVDFKLPHCSMILKKPFQIFEDLTFINLSHSQSITQIPDLSGAKNLRRFTLDKCRKLVRFDISIGFLPNLVYLSASGCTELKCFVPKMFLPSLQEISFNFCEKLEYFPHVMQKMDKLLKIHMINTAVKEFPKSIGNLTGLQYIDMSHCRRVKDLSSSFLLLPKLLTLKIDGCPQLGEAFQRFKDHHSRENGYPNLETLHFSEANLSYEDVDAIIECFPKLTDLKVSHSEFIALPECIRGSLHLKNLDVSFCNNLAEIPELPLSIQKIDARHCPSLTSEASSLLWSKVSQEIQRIQVVMPMLKREFPEWFDCIYSEGIPIFWARRKFPIVALALVFQEVKKTTDDVPTFSDKIRLLYGIKRWYTVSLHLFIDGQEICGRDFQFFNVGEDHVLLCDLRVLFSDEEWQNLDASLGDDWSTIQVQCVPNLKQDLILTNWGVYVYKQETSMNNIRFIPPNLIKPFSNMLSSCLVPQRSFEKTEQYMKHILNSFKLTDLLNADSICQQSVSDISLKVLLRSLRNAKAEITGEASSSLCGASLKQDREDSVADVVQVLEMLKENAPKHFAEHEYYQIEEEAVENLLTAHVELENTLNIRMPIVLVFNILEIKYQRYWGDIEIKLGDPVFKSVLSRFNDFPFRVGTTTETSATVLELKCQPLFEEEASSSSIEESLEEGYHDPVFEEFMRRIEQDAMSLNKHYGKMKASIVQIDGPFSEFYEGEAFLFKTITRNRFMRLMMFGSPFKIKITPYGMIRSEDESLFTVRTCFWLLYLALLALILLSYGFTHTILLWGWLLVKKIFVVSCKKVYWIINKSIMRVKKKEL